MTFGFSHIALSASSKDDAKIMLELGFEELFSETAIRCDLQKRTLLNQMLPVHDLSLMRPHGKGISVELTHHSQPSGAHAPYIPLFFIHLKRLKAIECAERFKAFNTAIKEIYGVDAFPMSLPIAGGVVLATEHEGETNVPTVLYSSSDLDSEIAFWDALGLTLRDRTEQWAMLEMCSFIASFRGTILVIRGKSVDKAMLDSPGFPCLALLTRDIQQELRGVTRSGGRVCGQEFTLTVGGKLLKIQFCRTPSGGPVELVQILGPG